MADGHPDTLFHRCVKLPYPYASGHVVIGKIKGVNGPQVLHDVYHSGEELLALPARCNADLVNHMVALR